MQVIVTLGVSRSLSFILSHQEDMIELPGLGLQPETDRVPAHTIVSTTTEHLREVQTWDWTIKNSPPALRPLFERLPGYSMVPMERFTFDFPWRTS